MTWQDLDGRISRNTWKHFARALDNLDDVDRDRDASSELRVERPDEGLDERVIADRLTEMRAMTVDDST